MGTSRRGVSKARRKRHIRQCLKSELDAVTKQWERDSKRAKRVMSKVTDENKRGNRSGGSGRRRPKQKKVTIKQRMKAELQEVTKKWEREQPKPTVKERMLAELKEVTKKWEREQPKPSHKERMQAELEEVTKKWQREQPKPTHKDRMQAELEEVTKKWKREQPKPTHQERMQAELDEVTKQWQSEQPKPTVKERVKEELEEVTKQWEQQLQQSDLAEGTKGPKSEFKKAKKNTSGERKMQADRKHAPLSAKQRARLVHSKFMKPHRLSFALQHIVGRGPLPRPEVIKRVWQYIKTHRLQDPEDKRIIVPDVQLSRVFGGEPINMFDMAQVLSKHLGWRSRVTDFWRF